MCDNRQFWIVKPPNLNNGTGIHVIPNNIDSIPEYPTCVQSYIKGPLLIDGYKVYLEVLWSFLLPKMHVRGTYVSTGGGGPPLKSPKKGTLPPKKPPIAIKISEGPPWTFWLAHVWLLWLTHFL